jgi:hypothetical protein
MLKKKALPEKRTKRSTERNTERELPEEKLTSKTKAKSSSLEVHEAPIVFNQKKQTPIKHHSWKTSDFKPASYNPRYITDARLHRLTKSIHSLGDLSGVVFNARTKRLVSGHQRLKTISGLPSSVKVKPYTDSYGTIELGYIEAHSKKGTIKLPLRIVDWSNDKVEKVANIASNSHGGEFDQSKLQKILQELDTKTFDIELIGLDPLTIMSLSIPKDTESRIANKDGSYESGDDDDDGEGFEEYSPESFDFSCQCPRCGYKFDPKKPNKSTKKTLTQAKRDDRVSSKKKMIARDKKLKNR